MTGATYAQSQTDPASDDAPGPWHTDPTFAWIDGPGQGAMHTDAVEAFLASMLSERQMRKVEQVLGHPDAWGALGPNAPAGPPRPEPPRPAKTVTLDLPEPGTGHGSGTADDPWRGVLADFFADYTFPEHDIEAYASYPEQERLDAYLDGLGYEPVTVKAPAGHYREWSLNVPPGVWLVGVGENAVHISPDLPDGDIRGALIELQIGAGLENIHLDGSNIPGFHFGERAVPGRLESSPEHPVHAVLAQHRVWVIDCVIRNFTHSGIRAAGSRGRRGSFGTAVGNIIENIGYSGVSAQSRWLVQDNQLRHCGYLRASWAGGDDPIIPRWGVETAVLNNLVLNGRSAIPGKLGRHVISGQTAHRCLVAGNIAIADGSQRNNIQFSDGSHNNRFVGNLTIATASTNSAIQVGVGANGFGNVIEYNVSLMNPQGFRPGKAQGNPKHYDFDPDDPPTGYIRHNYAEYRRNLLHRMVEPYVTVGNQGRDIGGATLELIDPERFGFFRSTR